MAKPNNSKLNRKTKKKNGSASKLGNKNPQSNQPKLAETLKKLYELLRAVIIAERMFDSGYSCLQQVLEWLAATGFLL